MFEGPVSVSGFNSSHKTMIDENSKLKTFAKLLAIAV